MKWFWSLSQVLLCWGLALVLAWMALAGGTPGGLVTRAAEAMFALGAAALAATALISRGWHWRQSPEPRRPSAPVRKGA